MKIKYIVLAAIMLLVCGCQKVNDLSVETIIGKISNKIDKVNIYRTGYSYYIPSGLTVKEYSLYNEVIESEDYTFYLYFDLISYYNKEKIEYKPNTTSYYSRAIDSDGKYGYLEINLKENNQYLIEIMYNYAKIEVMVDKNDINLALRYAVSILRSIEYNDDIISNMLGDNVLSFQEEVYNIFNTTSSDSLYLRAVEEDQYVEDEVKDTDLIN